MKTIRYIFIFFVAIIFSCKKEKNRICELYSADIDYSIGKIYSIEKVPFTVNYKYDFKVNQTIYNGIKKAYGIGQDDSNLISKSYVVVYDKNNPNNSDLNFSYPIRDSTNFNEHLLTFQNEKPKFSFPRKCD